MTEQETKDLTESKDKVQSKMNSTYGYMVSVLRYSPTELLHSGFRDMTIAQAIEKILIDSEKEIAKIWKEHLRKYPD